MAFGNFLDSIDVMRVRITSTKSILIAFSREDSMMIKRLRAEVGPTLDEYGIISSVQEKDGVIVDVGANVGVTSITAATFHPTLQTISFEPVPTTFFLLYYNLLLNEIPILSSHELRLGGRPGVLPVHAALSGSSEAKVIRWSVQASNMAVVDRPSDSDRLDNSFLASLVHSVSLESFLNIHGGVDACVRLLKMDCEGCEFETIPAMPSFISDQRRVRRFSAEIHQSLRSREEFTYASKPSPEQLRRTDEILLRRGCDPMKTIVHC